MGSGMFPLSTKSGLDPYGWKLKETADWLRDVQAQLYSAVYSGDSGGSQFDNAARDGAALERLAIAEQLIRGCITAD